jgi:hypothetical protein
MNFSKALWIVFPLLLFPPQPLSADTYPRQTGIDAWHYIFRLTLSDNTDEIVGEATAGIRFVKAGVSEVALDLASAAAGKGMTVSEVTSAGAPVRFTHQSDHLLLTLSQSVSPIASKPSMDTESHRGQGLVWNRENTLRPVFNVDEMGCSGIIVPVSLRANRSLEQALGTIGRRFGLFSERLK